MMESVAASYLERIDQLKKTQRLLSARSRCTKSTLTELRKFKSSLSRSTANPTLISVLNQRTTAILKQQLRPAPISWSSKQRANVARQSSTKLCVDGTPDILASVQAFQRCFPTRAALRITHPSRIIFAALILGFIRGAHGQPYLKASEGVLARKR